MGYWQNSIRLFQRAVDVTHDNFIAHHDLGAALGRAGRTEEAQAQLEQAQKLLPDRARGG